MGCLAHSTRNAASWSASFQLGERQRQCNQKFCLRSFNKFVNKHTPLIARKKVWGFGDKVALKASILMKYRVDKNLFKVVHSLLSEKTRTERRNVKRAFKIPEPSLPAISRVLESQIFKRFLGINRQAPILSQFLSNRHLMTHEA